MAWYRPPPQRSTSHSFLHSSRQRGPTFQDLSEHLKEHIFRFVFQAAADERTCRELNWTLRFLRRDDRAGRLRVWRQLSTVHSSWTALVRRAYFSRVCITALSQIQQTQIGRNTISYPSIRQVFEVDETLYDSVTEMVLQLAPNVDRPQEQIQLGAMFGFLLRRCSLVEEIELDYMYWSATRNVTDLSLAVGALARLTSLTLRWPPTLEMIILVLTPLKHLHTLRLDLSSKFVCYAPEGFRVAFRLNYLGVSLPVGRGRRPANHALGVANMLRGGFERIQHLGCEVRPEANMENGTAIRDLYDIIGPASRNLRSLSITTTNRNGALELPDDFPACFKLQHLEAPHIIPNFTEVDCVPHILSMDFGNDYLAFLRILLNPRRGHLRKINAKFMHLLPLEVWNAALAASFGDTRIGTVDVELCVFYHGS
ncbi:hypothetical protein BT69DRAFT_1351695 [Atractiella rhizophila]|nr:hypothetical protein BT69DRAFT_1351695 [Atractiella rhizophila]